MPRFLVPSLLVLSLLATPSLAQSQSDSSVPTIPDTQIEPRKVATPLEFVATAAAANDFELQAAEKALRLSTNEKIKAFATMIKADHTAAGQELVAAADADGQAIAPASPDGEQVGMLGKLDAVTGGDFDALYVETQIYAHQRAIALFKGYAEGGSNLNRFAARTLPALVHHYAQAVALSEELKAGKPQ